MLSNYKNRMCLSKMFKFLIYFIERKFTQEIVFLGSLTSNLRGNSIDSKLGLASWTLVRQSRWLVQVWNCIIFFVKQVTVLVSVWNVGDISLLPILNFDPVNIWEKPVFLDIRKAQTVVWLKDKDLEKEISCCLICYTRPLDLAHCDLVFNCLWHIQIFEWNGSWEQFA